MAQMTILQIAVVLLVVTALGGVASALYRFRGSNPPLALGTVHGIVAASSLVTLIAAGVVEGFSTTLTIGLGLLVVSALGGFVLYATHLRRKLISLPITVVHALISVSGFAAVGVAAFA